MSSYPIGEAKTQLSQLIARAEAGEEVIIRRGATPAVRLVPVEEAAPRAPRSALGLLRGAITIADDFDDELPEFFDPIEPQPTGT